MQVSRCLYFTVPTASTGHSPPPSLAGGPHSYSSELISREEPQEISWGDTRRLPLLPYNRKLLQQTYRYSYCMRHSLSPCEILRVPVYGSTDSCGYVTSVKNKCRGAQGSISGRNEGDICILGRKHCKSEEALPCISAWWHRRGGDVTNQPAHNSQGFPGGSPDCHSDE